MLVTNFPKMKPHVKTWKGKEKPAMHIWFDCTAVATHEGRTGNDSPQAAQISMVL